MGVFCKINKNMPNVKDFNFSKFRNADRVLIVSERLNSFSDLKMFLKKYGMKAYYHNDLKISEINHKFRFMGKDYDENVISYFETIDLICRLFKVKIEEIHDDTIRFYYRFKPLHTTIDKQISFFNIYAGSYWTHIEKIKKWDTPLIASVVEGHIFDIHPGRTRLRISSPEIRNSKSDVITFIPKNFRVNLDLGNEITEHDFKHCDFDVRLFKRKSGVKQMELHSYNSPYHLKPFRLRDDKIDLKWEKDTLYINEKELITVKPFEIPVWHKMDEYHLINDKYIHS